VHPRDRVWLRRLEGEMEMISHDDVRVHSPPNFPHASPVTPANERRPPAVAKMSCRRLPRLIT
jgi:hypothetical protein